MNEEEISKRLRGLLDMHAAGCCTNGEVVYATIQLLGDADAMKRELWIELPEWIKDGVMKVLADFEPNGEFYLPAHSEPLEIVKGRFALLKSWLFNNEFTKV